MHTLYFALKNILKRSNVPLLSFYYHEERIVFAAMKLSGILHPGLLLQTALLKRHNPISFGTGSTSEAWLEPPEELVRKDGLISLVLQCSFREYKILECWSYRKGKRSLIPSHFKDD